MPTIDRYAHTVIKQRAVPNTVNPQAIQDAGLMANATAAVTGMAAEYAQKVQDAANAAKLNNAVLSYQRDVIDASDKWRRDNMGNPTDFAQRFEDEAKKIGDKYLEQFSDAKVKEQFRSTMGRVNLQNYESNLSWQNQRHVTLAAEEIENAAQTNNAIAFRFGREGGSLDDVLKNADASTVAGATFLAPEAVQHAHETMRSGAVTNYFEGLLASGKTGEAKKLLDSKKYDDAFGADGLQRGYDLIEREQKRQSAETQELIRDDISHVNDAAKMGLKIPRANLEDLAARADTAGLGEQAGQLRLYADVQDKAADFAVQPIKAQTESLASLRADIEGGNFDKLEEYKALSNVYENKLKMIEQDPWAYYAAHDIVHAPEPINFTDPESVKAGLAKRRTDSAVVRDMEGFALPLLSANEVKQFKTSFEQAPPEQVAAQIQALGDAMTDDERRGLSQQFAKNDSALIAAAMGQPPEVAKGIMLGDAAKGEVSADKVRETANLYLEGTTFDAEVNESVQAGVYAYYKKLSLDAGDTGKDVNRERVQKAIEAVVGSPAEISVNGMPSKILLHRENGDFIKPSMVEDVLESFDDQILKKAHGSLPMINGAPIDPEDIKGKASFVTMGPGEYIAVYPGLGYIMDQNGRPYVFDLNKMKKAFDEAGKVPKSKSSEYGRRLVP